MRRAAAVLLLAAVPIPALAQPGVEARVGKLESEMRAVQRKVFPGGAGTYLEPQIAPADEPATPPAGTPATGAIEDLNGRVASLEGQMSTLTGQIEQNQYRIRQLEEAFAAAGRDKGVLDLLANRSISPVIETGSTFAATLRSNAADFRALVDATR